MEAAFRVLGACVCVRDLKLLFGGRKLKCCNKMAHLFDSIAAFNLLFSALPSATCNRKDAISASNRAFSSCICESCV